MPAKKLPAHESRPADAPLPVNTLIKRAQKSNRSVVAQLRQLLDAHRRFRAALRLLTAVRRLPRPAVQVNIGEQQVNVSGG